jgi:hypothetical protein
MQPLAALRGAARRSHAALVVLGHLEQVVLGKDGQLRHSSIDGFIQLRNFMASATELRLMLNDGLTINSQSDGANKYRGAFLLPSALARTRSTQHTRACILGVSPTRDR